MNFTRLTWLANVVAVLAAACPWLNLAAAEPAPVRFATFNASLNRNNAGDLVSDLSLPPNPGITQSNRIQQIRTVAEIIQRVNPDVLLLNEFDYYPNYQAIDLFRSNFLAVAQNTLNQTNPASPVDFPYRFVEPSNTGIPSGYDLDNNGAVGGGNDAFGFGNFPGQYGLALLSKYPILTNQTRTFQNFLWRDMPGALLPDDASKPGTNDWYSAEELAVVRLSSKSHWDVPIDIQGTVVHALVSHPTPPSFDGAEDRNGKRNHDEIRFWADYIAPERSAYIYDDQGGAGGLAARERFVIMGDQNADPFDGDSVAGAVTQLLAHPLVNSTFVPTSPGAVEQAALQGQINTSHRGPAAQDTADFADTSPGNLRVDYVLPSASGLKVLGGAVFWPTTSDPNFRLVGTYNNPNYFSGFPSSDHKLVSLDLEVLFSAAIAAQGTNVMISWPAGGGSCQLQATPALGPHATWQAVTNLPAAQGSRLTVTLDLTTSHRFFRLVRP